MLSWLVGGRVPLEQLTLKVLREFVASNGSALPPFRLPQVARQLVVGLLEFVGGGGPTAALAFGAQLGVQGLGLRSLLAVGQTWAGELVAQAGRAAQASGDVADAAGVAQRVQEFMAQAVEGLAGHDLVVLSRQRDEMHAALERVVHDREHELRQAILELSTPVVPVYEQILVLPLVGRIDEERAARISEGLLREVTRWRARVLIIDVSGVPDGDAGFVRALVRTAQAVRLLGARPVLVGIRAEMAGELARLAVELEGLYTLANLQAGIEWALRESGLAIRQLPGPGNDARSGRR